MPFTPETRQKIRRVRRLSAIGKALQSIEEDPKAHTPRGLLEFRPLYEAAFAELIHHFILKYGRTELLKSSVIVSGRFEDTLMLDPRANELPTNEEIEMIGKIPRLLLHPRFHLTHPQEVTLNELLLVMRNRKAENDEFALTKITAALSIIEKANIILKHNKGQVGTTDLPRVIKPITLWTWSPKLQQPIFLIEPLYPDTHEPLWFSALEIWMWVNGANSKIPKRTHDRSLEWETQAVEK